MLVKEGMRVEVATRIKEFSEDKDPEVDEPDRVIPGKVRTFVRTKQGWRDEETGRFVGDLKDAPNR